MSELIIVCGSADVNGRRDTFAALGDKSFQTRMGYEFPSERRQWARMAAEVLYRSCEESLQLRLAAGLRQAIGEAKARGGDSPRAVSLEPLWCQLPESFPQNWSEFGIDAHRFVRRQYLCGPSEANHIVRAGIEAMQAAHAAIREGRRGQGC